MPKVFQPAQRLRLLLLQNKLLQKENQLTFQQNYLMNQLLDQETIVSELEESIKIHTEEHRQLAELIAGINQMEQDLK